MIFVNYKIYFVKFDPLVFFLGIYWTMSILYCFRWHHRKGNLNYSTFFMSLIIGPAMVLILMDDDQHTKKINSENVERNDRKRRWFRTMSEINRQTIPSFGRTIPPPPPMSRIERMQSDRDDAIRMARERLNLGEVRGEWRRQNGINNLKDFKFFQK